MKLVRCRIQKKLKGKKTCAGQSGCSGPRLEPIFTGEQARAPAQGARAWQRVSLEESVDRGQGPQGLEGHTEKAAQGHMKAAGQESWRLAPPEAVAETVIPLCCWGEGRN